MKRAFEPCRAKDALAAVLERYGVARNVRAHRLVTDWTQIVGPRIAARAWPEAISGGVLWVRVANAAWLQELSLLRDDLLARVTDALEGAVAIEDIKLRLKPRGADPEDRPTARRPPSRPRLLPRREPAVGSELETIRREVDAVDDPDLREIIFEARRRLAL
jgi:hypothetical protein